MSDLPLSSHHLVRALSRRQSWGIVCRIHELVKPSIWFLYRVFYALYVWSPQLASRVYRAQSCGRRP